MLSLVILTVSIAVSLLVGCFVYIRNPKQILNRIYAISTISSIIFSIFNYISLGTVHRLIDVRIVMASTSVAIAGIYYIIYFINKDTKFQRLNIIILFSTIIVIILDSSSYVFKGLSKGNNPIPIPSYGIVIYLFHFLTLLFLSGFVLIKGIIKKNGIIQQQNKYLLIGVIPILLIAPITSFIFPILLNNPHFIYLSPIYAMFFVCMVGYTIIKHGLFDIKPIIARALTYGLSLSIVAAIYGFIMLGLIRLIFHPHLSLGAQLFLAIATALTALSFQRIKTLFNKVTNKYLFQDSYDIQTFLDNFNKVIVSSFDLEPMLKNITEIMEKNIKPSYCLFGIKEDGDRPRRLIGTKNHPDFTEDEIAFVSKLTPTMKRKVIVTDLLEDKYKDLQVVLQKNNISIIARLATSLREEGVGYIILGPKKSGNMYNSQDLKVLEIIANELVIAIQNSLRTEEIENFNLTLQERVKTATNRLKNTNDKLRALDEAKDDFVSMASHQLRTPLTSVKGNISLVLDGDAGNITGLQRQLLEQAFTSSQRMVYLIADLLNVSRLKTGKFIIEAAPVDFPSVVEDEVNQLVDTAKSRHLTLSYQKPEHITTLMLDETKTRQVIMNFIDNAIYYTPAGGRIDVVLTETETAVELRVIDNGIGVPSREQHHLFTKFYRAVNARKARPDGTGLGLFMAKKVIISEGGSIIFQTQEGQGSTFGFSFPKASLSQENYKNLPTPQEQAASIV